MNPLVTSQKSVQGPGDTVHLLGQGGTSIVEKVLVEGIHYAQKRLLLPRPYDPAKLSYMRSRFAREIDLLRSLKHPHIPHVFADYEYSISPELMSLPAYRMTLAEATINERLETATSKEIDLQTTVSFYFQAAYTLAFIHKQGVIHRDLKPDNLLMTRENILLVTDFGLSKNTDDSTGNLTQLGNTGGTQGFQSPEQAIDLKSATKASDIFSFGASLMNTLCGRNPTPYDLEENRSSLNSKMKVPQLLQDFLELCLDIDPNSRPQNGGEMAKIFINTLQKMVYAGSIGPVLVPYTYFESLMKLLHSGDDSLLPQIPIAYSLKPSAGVTDFTNHLSDNAINNAVKSKNPQFLIELIRNFNEREYSLTQSWADVETGGQIFRKVCQAFQNSTHRLREPKAILELQVELSSSLLERTVTLNRFAGGREFLRFFSGPNRVPLAVLTQVFANNPAGQLFIKQEVNYEKQALPEDVLQLMGP